MKEKIIGLLETTTNETYLQYIYDLLVCFNEKEDKEVHTD